MRDNTVRIMQGGTLQYYTHQYNEEYSVREQVVADVTNEACRFFFKECTFENGVTLRDIFTIVEENIAFFAAILPYHVQEFIAESKEKIGGEPAFDDDSILEVCWSNEHDNFEGVNELVSYINFHAISAKDEFSSALDFVPVNHFIDLPITLNTDFKIYGRIGYSDSFKNKDNGTNCFDFGGKLFNLIGIIEAIFHELSFYGPPSRRDENKTAILNISRRGIGE